MFNSATIKHQLSNDHMHWHSNDGLQLSETREDAKHPPLTDNKHETNETATQYSCLESKTQQTTPNYGMMVSYRPGEEPWYIYILLPFVI